MRYKMISFESSKDFEKLGLGKLVRNGRYGNIEMTEALISMGCKAWSDHMSRVGRMSIILIPFDMDLPIKLKESIIQEITLPEGEKKLSFSEALREGMITVEVRDDSYYDEDKKPDLDYIEDIMIVDDFINSGIDSISDQDFIVPDKYFPEMYNLIRKYYLFSEYYPQFTFIWDTTKTEKQNMRIFINIIKNELEDRSLEEIERFNKRYYNFFEEKVKIIRNTPFINKASELANLTHPDLIEKVRELYKEHYGNQEN